MFKDLYRDRDRTKPFYAITRSEDRGVAHDIDKAKGTIGKVIEANVQDFGYYST